MSRYMLIIDDNTLDLADLLNARDVARRDARRRKHPRKMRTDGKWRYICDAYREAFFEVQKALGRIP